MDLEVQEENKQDTTEDNFNKEEILEETREINYKKIIKLVKDEVLKEPGQVIRCNKNTADKLIEFGKDSKKYEDYLQYNAYGILFGSLIILDEDVKDGVVNIWK